MAIRASFLLLCCVACAAELEVPETLEIVCADDADCPGGRLCAPLIGRCVTTVDSDPPSIVNAESPASERVRVVFSEPVLCSAAIDTGAYAITPALPVALVTGRGCSDSAPLTTEALLFTDVQSPGAPYEIVVTGIRDGGGNALLATGSSATFSGFGQPPDASPPTPLLPTDHARTLGPTQGLAWTFRPGASSYVVEVATDPAFATQIVGSPFTINAPETTLQLQGLSDITYYWRLRSNLTAPGAVLPVHDFDVLNDTVYVACPGSGPCDASGIHNGSRTRPYTSVQRALAAAAELSTTRDVATVAVKLAARGPSAAYDGPVVLQWQSAMLSGGWSSDFSARDDDASQTVIANDGTVLSVSNIPVPLTALVEGLTLRSTSSALRSSALTISTAGSGLMVSNVIVRGYSGQLTGLVEVVGGPAVGPTLERCQVIVDVAPGGTFASGMVVSNAAPRLVGFALTFGDATSLSSVAALEVRGPLPGDLIMEDSVLDAPAAALGSTALFVNVDSASAGSVVLRRVTARSGSAESSEVLEMQGTPRVTIDDSVLAVGPGTLHCHVVGEDTGGELAIRNSVLQGTSGPSADCETVQLEANVRAELTNNLLIGPLGGSATLAIARGHPVLTNNIIVGRAGPCVLQPWDFSQLPIGGTPTAFQNNVLVGCPQAYGTATSASGTPPPSFATSDSEVDAMSGLPLRDGVCSTVADCPHARFVANRVLPSVTLAQTLVDVDGPDNEMFTIADNDYHTRSTADSAIRQGGLLAGVDICAPLGEMAVCDIPTVDRDGDARSFPFSVGPDEVP